MSFSHHQKETQTIEVRLLELVYRKHVLTMPAEVRIGTNRDRLRGRNPFHVFEVAPRSDYDLGLQVRGIAINGRIK